MKNSHKKFIDAAEKAIDDLFSDTTVSRGQTAADLLDLIDFIQSKIESLDLPK